MAFVRKKYMWLWIALLCFVPFVLLLFKGGYNSLHHDYYFVPFVPVMAILAAFGLSEMKNQRIAFIFLLAIVLEGILNQYHDFRIKSNEAQLLTLESRLDGIMERDDLIAINSPFVPTPMYFAHRKGWLCSAESLNQAEYITGLKTDGLDFIVVLKNAYEGDMQLPYEEVFSDDIIRVYKP